MQKLFFIFIMAFFAIVLSFSNSVPAIGMEEGVIINLRRLPAGEDHDSPRSLVITAFVDYDLSCVNASLNDAGAIVEVYIENQDTAEQYNYQIPGTGNSVLPISGTSGYWTITFILSNGDEYVGYFIL